MIYKTLTSMALLGFALPPIPTAPIGNIERRVIGSNLRENRVKIGPKTGSIFK